MKIYKPVFVIFMLLMLGVSMSYAAAMSDEEAALMESLSDEESVEPAEPAPEGNALGMDMQEPGPSQTIVVTPEDATEDEDGEE